MQLKISKQSTKRWESYSLEELIALREHISSLTENKRLENIPNIKDAVCDIIAESGLTPEDLGLKIIDKSLRIKKNVSDVDMGRLKEEKDISFLESASIEELKAMLQELMIGERIQKARLQREYRRKLWKIIRESGVKPDAIGFEVIDKRYKMGPKYRNPETGQIWAGKGKTPNWITKYENEGKRRDEFLVSVDAP